MYRTMCQRLATAVEEGRATDTRVLELAGWMSRSAVLEDGPRAERKAALRVKAAQR